MPWKLFIFFTINSVLSTAYGLSEARKFDLPHSRIRLLIDPSCEQKKITDTVRNKFREAMEKIGQCLDSWDELGLNEEQREILDQHLEKYRKLRSKSFWRLVKVTCQQNKGTCGHAVKNVDQWGQIGINIVPKPECYESLPIYVHEIFHLFGENYHHTLPLLQHPDYTIACTYKCTNGLSYLNEPKSPEAKNALKDLCLSKQKPYDWNHIAQFNTYFKRGSKREYQSYQKHINFYNDQWALLYEELKNFEDLIDYIKNKKIANHSLNQNKLSLFFYEIMSSNHPRFTRLRSMLLQWALKREENFQELISGWCHLTSPF